MTRISAFFTATKNRVRGMLVKSGKQFSLDSHFDIGSTVVGGGRAEDIDDDAEQLTRVLGMKCAWRYMPCCD